MPDDAAPDQHYETPYLVTMPDGSTGTRILTTTRPPTVGEIADHASTQGMAFAGFPEGPAAPPRPPAEEPSPVMRAAPPPPEPSLAERAGGVLFPKRSFVSQLPSIGGATAGAYLGGAAGAATGPFAPVAIPLGMVTGAALGGAGGEVAQYGGEQVLGAEPAEPGTFGQRVGNAAIRSGVTEGVAYPVGWGASMIASKALPAARAAGELAPVLEQSLPAEVKAVQDVSGRFANINRLLGSPQELANFRGVPGTQDTLLRAWWQRMAGREPTEIVQAWNTLGEPGQIALAGGRRDAMQTVVNTFAEGAAPVGWGELATAGGGAGAGGLGYIMGHPASAVLAGVPLAAKGIAESPLVPWLSGRLLRTPGGAQFLTNLPTVTRVASPVWQAGVQSVAAPLWPEASTLP